MREDERAAIAPALQEAEDAWRQSPRGTGVAPAIAAFLRALPEDYWALRVTMTGYAQPSLADTAAAVEKEAHRAAEGGAG